MSLYEINYQEVIDDWDYWYLKDGDYNLDDNWIITLEEPSIYPAFQWREIHTYRSPCHYFEVAIRENTKHTIALNGIEHDRGIYSVIVGAARSGVPLPLSTWLRNEHPWKSGSDVHIDCFYGGETYKDIFEYHKNECMKSETGTPSFLQAGFDTEAEARNFAEKWKTKLIEDHALNIKKERDLLYKILMKQIDFIKNDKRF